MWRLKLYKVRLSDLFNWNCNPIYCIYKLRDTLLIFVIRNVALIRRKFVEQINAREVKYIFLEYRFAKLGIYELSNLQIQELWNSIACVRSVFLPSIINREVLEFIKRYFHSEHIPNAKIIVQEFHCIFFFTLNSCYYEAKIARATTIDGINVAYSFSPFSVRQVTRLASLPAFFDSFSLDNNYPVHWERNALSHMRLGAIALWLVTHRSLF